MAYRKKDTPCPIRETAPWNEVPVHRPVTSRARHYPPGTHIAPHRHRRHQLVFAMSGLMVVRADGGRWVVPSTRAIWVPAGMVHAVDCIAEVHMRSLYVEPDFAPQLPDGAFAVQVAPLLRELLLAASLIESAHVDDSRDGRVVRLLLDELPGAERQVLRLRLGFTDAGPCSLVETARRQATTVARVRGLEERGLDRLRMLCPRPGTEEAG